MATRYHHPEVAAFDRLREQIDAEFESIVNKVIRRRDLLLQELNLLEQEVYIARTACMQTIEDLKAERKKMELLLASLKMNQSRAALEKGISDITDEIKMNEEKAKLAERVSIDWAGEDLESNISKYGIINVIETKVPNPQAESSGQQKQGKKAGGKPKKGKNYNKKEQKKGTKGEENTGEQQKQGKAGKGAKSNSYSRAFVPLSIFGKLGKEIESFECPRGVCIDDANDRIFVADFMRQQIQVLSMKKGTKLAVFGKSILKSPWEIVLCDNFIFVSDWSGNFISKWISGPFSYVKKSTAQLSNPAGLDVDDGEVFVVEFGNNRITVLDATNLNFIRIMAKKAIGASHCLRVKNNTVYVVEDNGVVKMFSKTNQLLRTFTEFSKIQRRIFHFTIDSQLNLLLTNNGSNSLNVLSPEGDLICTAPFSGFSLHDPFGIDVSKDGRIVVSFQTSYRDVRNAIVIF